MLPKAAYSWGAFSGSTERPVATSMIYSQPRHPAWTHILRRIVSNINNRFYGDDPLSATGPLAVYWALQEYIKSGGSEPRRDLRWHSGSVEGAAARGIMSGIEYERVARFDGSDQVVAFEDRQLHNSHGGKYDRLWRLREMYTPSAHKSDTTSIQLYRGYELRS